jgi:hypothetical protein
MAIETPQLIPSVMQPLKVDALNTLDDLPWCAEAEAIFQRESREHDLDEVISSTFPVYQSATLEHTEDALARLEALISKLREHGEYSLVRDEYCILSILLNQQGVIAPAFRPEPITGKRRGNPVFFDIHRDQVVIDCHWLYCKKLMFKTRDVEFLPMFNTEGPFPFDLAWKFAKKVWKSKHRTDEALTLTHFQQCQLVALRGEEVSARFGAALDGLRKSGGRIPAKIAAVRQSLNMWAEKNKRIENLRDEYEHLWLARELLGSLPSIRQITELSALMSGAKFRDDKTIREKLKRMDRHINRV